MAVHIERLPDERAATMTGAAAAGACCSCCCCCLHSVGGVVLAAAARPKLAEPGTRASVRKEYWLSFAAVTVIALGWMSLQMRGEEALLFLAIFLPGAQLAASVIALVASSISRTPGHEDRLRHLGRITLLGVAGGVAGLALMWVIYLAS